MVRRYVALLLVLICLVCTACSFGYDNSESMPVESMITSDDNAGGHDVVTKQDELETNLDALTNDDNAIDLSNPVTAFKFFWEVIKYEFGYYD